MARARVSGEPFDPLRHPYKGSQGGDLPSAQGGEKDGPGRPGFTSIFGWSSGRRYPGAAEKSMSIRIEKIDACRWRLPREGKMRTEGLVFASRSADGGASGRSRPWSRCATWPPCRGSSARPSPCPTSTGATASPSAGWPPSTPTRGWSPPAGSATTSTAGCACCARLWRWRRSARI